MKKTSLWYWQTDMVNVMIIPLMVSAVSNPAVKFIYRTMLSARILSIDDSAMLLSLSFVIEFLRKFLAIFI